jgi:hypothetical protein
MALFGIDAKGLGEAVGAVGTLAKDIRTAITGKAILDPSMLAQLETKALEIEAASANAQAAVNAVEAASPKMFVSGWRPAVGWCLAMAIFYQFVGRPIALGIVPGLPLVSLSMDELWPMIAGMLGLVGARSFEKAKGVAR